ncbi:MAG: hypothetical protein IT289_09695 [Oligoflexia bacterium]|nr:hypothetical protein [Oligoflexia bacterium]
MAQEAPCSKQIELSPLALAAIHKINEGGQAEVSKLSSAVEKYALASKSDRGMDQHMFWITSRALLKVYEGLVPWLTQPSVEKEIMIKQLIPEYGRISYSDEPTSSYRYMQIELIKAQISKTYSLNPEKAVEITESLTALMAQMKDDSQYSEEEFLKKEFVPSSRFILKDFWDKDIIRYYAIRLQVDLTSLADHTLAQARLAIKPACFNLP